MTTITTAHEARFWRKVDRSGECWIWTASRDRKGYGHFVIRELGIWRAHRFAYALLREPIPAGLTIDHLCRNPSCVNPDHMEPVTLRENVLRGGNSIKTACANGHEFSHENTRLKRRADGRTERVCRECERARDRARYRRAVAA